MVELNFTKEETNYILDKRGYVTEDVLAYFPIYYGTELGISKSNLLQSYGSMHKLVAYKKGERPKELQGERIYCDDISKFECSKVLTRLIKNKILDLF